MRQITMDIPEEILFALRSDEREFEARCRLAAAAKWYDLGLLSQERAAQLAGMSREGFLLALGSLQVSPFQETSEDLLRLLHRG